MIAADRQRGAEGASGPPRALVLMGCAFVVTTMGGATVAYLLAAPPRPASVAPTPAPVVVAPAPMPVTPPPPVAPKPLPKPLPEPTPGEPAPEPIVTPPKPVAPPAPPRALTNEEWLHRVFKSQHQKLQACVEQDLRVRPNAPTRYMVTLTFEPDGLPVNSFTQLTPKGSRAVWDCLRMAIFHVINEEGAHNRALPQRGNFTISLPLDFTGAKPATKAMVGFGDD